MQGLNHKLAAVVTAHIAVKPDGDYSELIHILRCELAFALLFHKLIKQTHGRRFDKKIGLTSCGITRPKVILCYGSDGRYVVVGLLKCYFRECEFLWLRQSLNRVQR